MFKTNMLIFILKLIKEIINFKVVEFDNFKNNYLSIIIFIKLNKIININEII